MAEDVQKLLVVEFHYAIKHAFVLRIDSLVMLLIYAKHTFLYSPKAGLGSLRSFWYIKKLHIIRESMLIS